MKKLLLLVLVVLAGVACGVILAFVQVQATSARVELLPEELAKIEPGNHSTKDVGELLPQAVVDNEIFDFGVMDKSGRSSHDFIVTNKGNAPLTLIKGRSTCKCTMAQLDRRTLMPGESTEIKVEWTARDYLGQFEQIATVQTNDPQRPEIELKIKGITTNLLEFVPDEVVFSPILAGRAASTKAKLLVRTDEPVKILDVKCAEPESESFFDIKHTPLSKDVLQAEANAKAGYEIEVAVKPGLPQGSFQQTIRFETTLPTAKMVELPVKGRIGSDINIIGPQWDKERGLLSIGMVDGAQGAKRTLRLVAHGIHRKDIKFKIAETWPPELLHAELGETTEINQGKATQTPLEIEIPKGARPANHLLSNQGTPGRIELESNYPDVPKIVILVQFAVEGG